MSKTSKKTQTSKQAADPALVKDYGDLTGVAQFLASLGFAPNRAATVAAMTPAQNASFLSTQNAAAAFGMPVATSTGEPTPQMSAGGILGHSTAPGFDEAVAGLPAGYAASIQELFKRLSAMQIGAAPGTAAASSGVPSSAALKESEPNTTGALSRFTPATARERAKTESVGEGLKALGGSIMSTLKSIASGTGKRK